MPGDKNKYKAKPDANDSQFYKHRKSFDIIFLFAEII
jgi:hypothetical protein